MERWFSYSGEWTETDMRMATMIRQQFETSAPRGDCDNCGGTGSLKCLDCDGTGGSPMKASVSEDACRHGVSLLQPCMQCGHSLPRMRAEKTEAEWFCVCGAPLESKEAACPKGCTADPR
jgi:hypothetical protein